MIHDTFEFLDTSSAPFNNFPVAIAVFTWFNSAHTHSRHLRGPYYIVQITVISFYTFVNFGLSIGAGAKNSSVLGRIIREVDEGVNFVRESAVCLESLRESFWGHPVTALIGSVGAERHILPSFILLAPPR
jgi:hypothetical protein